MKLLTKSGVAKLNKTRAVVEFAHDKLTVSPLSNGAGELSFPLPFACYKFINLSLSAKKNGEDGVAKIGVSYIRRGQPFGPKPGEQGFVEIKGEGYRHYLLHFLIPFGVDEAMITVTLSGGASVSVIDLDASVDFTAKKEGEGAFRCIADGGLSLYAPKNSSSAILAAIKAGFSSVIVDADQTSDGELIALGSENLSACSDGEGYASDYTMEELSALDFGFFAGAFYKGTPVMRLEDAIKAIVTAGVTPMIRITVRNFDFDKLEEITSRLCVERLSIISPDMSTLERASAYFPSASFGYVESELTPDRCERLAKMKSFVISNDRPKNMACAEQLGVGLVLIANDSEQLEQASRLGATDVITGVYQLDGCKI